jgi:hypothetical protein
LRLDWDAGLAFGRSASVPYFYSSARDAAALSGYLRRADTPSRLTGARACAQAPETPSLSEN